MPIEYITRCESALAGRRDTPHNGHWIIQTFHGPSGSRNADELCPHYWERAQAEAALRESPRRD